MKTQFVIFAIVCVFSTLTLARYHQPKKIDYLEEYSDEYDDMYDLYDPEDIIRSLRNLDAVNDLSESVEDIETPKSETEKLKKELKEELDVVHELEEELVADIEAVEEIKAVWDEQLGMKVQNKVELEKECTWTCPRWWFLAAACLAILGVALWVGKKFICV